MKKVVKIAMYGEKKKENVSKNEEKKLVGKKKEKTRKRNPMDENSIVG